MTKKAPTIESLMSWLVERGFRTVLVRDAGSWVVKVWRDDPEQARGGPLATVIAESDKKGPLDALKEAITYMRKLGAA